MGENAGIFCLSTEFGFPSPIPSAVASVYFQFLAAIAIILGFKIRPFCALMVFNFLIAIVFVHFASEGTIEGMTPALAIGFSCLTFVFTGAGKFSLDYYFYHSNRKEETLKALNGKLEL